METKPYWKKIWYIVTRRSTSVTYEDLEQVLDLIHNDIFTGITQYEVYTDLSFKKWKESIKSTSPKLEKLIQRLSYDLNIDSTNMWGIFCNYLIYEYNGKVEEVANMASYDIHLQTLTYALYLFYSRERSFILRSSIYIIGQLVQTSPMANIYVSFAKKHTLPKIRQNLIKQLKHLIYEISPETVEHCINLKQWVDRNYFEQFGVSLSYLLSLEYEPINYEDLLEFINVTMMYSCTELLPFDPIREYVDPKLKTAVMNTQLSILLVGYSQIYTKCDINQIEEIYKATDKRFFSLLLVWAILHNNHDCLTETSSGLTIYKEIFTKGNEDVVFGFLAQILSSEMLVESNAGYIIQKWIFNFYNDMCKLYEADIMTVKTVNILSMTLKNYKLAKACISGNLPTVISTACKMFPVHFLPLCKISSALANHTSLSQNVFRFLCNLVFFSDTFGEEMITSEVKKIDMPYTAKVPDDRGCELPPVSFPEGTEVILWNCRGINLATFIGRYNYFTVLSDYLYQVAFSFSSTDEDLENTLAGLDIIVSMLKSSFLTKEELTDNKEFSYCVNLIKGIYSSALSSGNKNLLYRCFQVFVAFVKFNIKQTIDILLITQFLPTYTSYELSLEYALQSNSLTKSVLFDFIHEECIAREMDFLLLYFEFFTDCYKKNAFHKKIVVPGFSFIFSHVFVRHFDWEYVDIRQKHQLSLNCMEIIFDVMQTDRQKLESIEQKQIYNFILHGFSEHGLLLDTFVNLIRMNYSNMNTLMQFEINWEKGENIIIFRILKICLAVLMLFLKNYNEDFAFKRVCDRCLSLDLSPNLVKIIVGIMAQDYDMQVSRVACNVLKKIIENYNVPLMAYLDMDRAQIQGAFLHKLRDPVEEDETKLLILDVITTCVVNGQHGMCAALFNINTLKSDKKQAEIGDSVTNFLIEHMRTLVQDNAYLYSPLQKPMLHLFHTLWSCKRSAMIDDLIKEKDFWPILADQLFKPMLLEDDSVAKVLDILMLDIVKNVDNVDPNLIRVLKKIYNTKEVFLENFYNYIVASITADKTKEYGTVCNSLRLIWSFKNFLMVSVKYVSSCFEDNKLARISLAEYCLRGLHEHLLHPGDIKIFSAFSDLYFFCLTQWGISCYGNIDERLMILKEIYTTFDRYVELVKLQDKEAILAIAAKTVIDVTERSPLELLKFEDFLNSVVPVVHKEYKILKYMTDTKTMADARAFAKAHRNWNAMILLGTSILQIPGSEKFGWWYKSTQFLEKIMYFVGLFIAHLETMHCAKLAVSFLVNYAESPLYNDFAYVDMKDFYYNINPPSIYDNTNITLEKFDINQLEDWWYTYRGILAMNLRLMQKLDVLVKNNVFYLFTLQLHVVKHLLLLPQATAEITALKLVKMLLLCFNMSLKWKITWQTEYQNELKIMVNALSQCMEQCVLILLKPKMISAYRLDDKRKGVFLEELPEKIFINIIEMIVDIIALVLQCFIKINPPILDCINVFRPTDTGILAIHNQNLFNMHQKTTFSHYVFHALHFLCKASSLIQTKRSNVLKLKLNVSDEEVLMIGDMRYFIYVMTTEMMNTVAVCDKQQNFFKHQETGISAPWLGQLNVDIVNNTLEKLVAFLTQQSWYCGSVQKTIMQGDLQKRKIQGELQVFHDYCKKKLQEIIHNTQVQGGKKPIFSRRRKEFEDENTFRHSFSLVDVDYTKEIMDSSVDDEYLIVMSILLQRSTKLRLPGLIY